MLNDVAHYYGGDLSVSASGDLLLASGDDRTKQRLLRRLLTNPALFTSTGSASLPADYTMQPTYGAGVSRWVGKAVTSYADLQGLIVAQLKQESSVAQSPAPVVTVTAITGGVSVSISYTDSTTNQPTVLAFDATA